MISLIMGRTGVFLGVMNKLNLVRHLYNILRGKSYFNYAKSIVIHLLPLLAVFYSCVVIKKKKYCVFHCNYCFSNRLTIYDYNTIANPITVNDNSNTCIFEGVDTYTARLGLGLYQELDGGLISF